MPGVSWLVGSGAPPLRTTTFFGSEFAGGSFFAAVLRLFFRAGGFGDGFTSGTDFSGTASGGCWVGAGLVGGGADCCGCSWAGCACCCVSPGSWGLVSAGCCCCSGFSCGLLFFGVVCCEL